MHPIFSIVITIVLVTKFKNIFCQKSSHNIQFDNNCTVLENCQEGEECFHYFVVWEDLKRVMIFNSSKRGYEIKENLGCTFPERIFDEVGIVLELWNKEHTEFFQWKDNSIVSNNTKINIKEIPHITVTDKGLYSNPNTTYPKNITTIQTEEDLRNELLKNYNKNVWPWTKMNSTCYIQTNIMFHKIIDVDLSHGSLSMLVWFRLRWNDPRFTWDPEDYNNITIVHFNQEEFWDPDIEIWNSLDSIEKLFQPQAAYVDFKGDLFWSRMGQIQISCDMKGLDEFPYDTSQCLFEVGSWAYDSSKVMMGFFETGYELDESTTSGKNAPFAQYNIKNVTTEFHPYPPFSTYPQNNSMWPGIKYNVVLHRNHAQYTYGIIIPQALLTFISFGAFWLPPSSGERIGFTITIPLAIAVYKLLMYQQLPASNELVFATKFSFGCFLFTIFVVIESIFAAMLWWRTDPYFLSPWKSFKKLIIDMKENKYWVDVIKAVDIEMTHLKVQQNPISLSQQFSQFVGSFRRPFSRNYQSQCNVELQSSVSLSNSGNFQQNQSQQESNNKVNSTQNIHQNESANDLYATRSFQSDALVNTLQRSRPQGIQEENSNSSSTENFTQFIDIEAQNITQNITFPLQNVEHAQNFLKQVLDNKQYEYALKSYKHLCETYSEQNVQNDLFRLMGMVDGRDCDFALAAKNKYNEKWRKLSNFVDRICQFTVVPSFLVFVFIITFQVADL